MSTRKRANGSHPFGVPVGAQDFADIQPAKGALNDTNWWMYGNLPVPTIPQYVLGSFVELMGCALLALTVVMANMGSSTTDGVVKGFYVGLAYALPVFIFSRLPIQSAVKPHLFTTYTISSAFASHIGPLGVLHKLVLQAAGAMIGGGIANALMSGVIVTNLQNSVEVPLKVGGFIPSSLTTTVCLNIFMPLFMIGIGFMVEHLRTDTSDEEKRLEHYKNGMLINAGSTLMVLIITTQMGSFMYSHVPYIGGLFAGINQAGNRNSGYLFYQTTVANGVWNGPVSGAAPALYLLAPLANALIIGGVFLLAFFAFVGWGYRNTPADLNVMRRKKNDDAAPMLPEQAQEAAPIKHIANANLGVFA